MHAAKTNSGKYLTFSMAGEEYGIGILKVREIIGMTPVAPVPQTPEFVNGVINLRGKVIPVMDLRARFGLPREDYTERTCIVVGDAGQNGSRLFVGVVVDSVSEVLHIRDAEIEDVPAFGTDVSTSYILGVAKMEGGIKMLLDIDEVLTPEEAERLQEAV